ncbi:MAG: polysaccharide biosynthesis C-terminal domain-containing protein [Blastocatellia bacterium]
MKKNIAIVFFTYGFTLLSGVVTSLLTAWALGPEGRGDLAVVVLWPNIVAWAFGLGLPQAYRYYLARQPASLSTHYSNALVFAFCGGLAAFGIAELVVPHLTGQRSPAVMLLVRIYLLNIPLALLFDLMAGLLEGAREFRWAAAARGSFYGTQSIAYLVLWLSGHLTVRNAAYTMMAAQLMCSSLAFLGVKIALRPRWQLGWAEWKDSLAYGLRYFPGLITAMATLRLDQMLLAAMASSTVIGLYVVAVRLSEITTVLASSVSDVLLPEVAACDSQKESLQLLAKSLRQTVYVYVLALIPLWVAAPYILRFAYGIEFLAATGTLRLLLIASLLWSAGSIVNSGLNGLGYPVLSTISRLASAAVTVVALLYWLPTHGIVGAAMASVLGYGVMLFVALYWLLRKQQISWRECIFLQPGDFPVRKLVTEFRLRLGFN